MKTARLTLCLEKTASFFLSLVLEINQFEWKYEIVLSRNDESMRVASSNVKYCKEDVNKMKLQQYDLPFT